MKVSISQDLEMKRVAIFVHYDSHNYIQDYVVYYIKELLKVAAKIVFVSDCNLSETELLKISPYVVNSIAYNHGEYDFGSYKRGYQWAKENGLLDDCEELIFANDSCYAPLFPFEDMFFKMSPKEIDFWGATANPKGIGIMDGKHFANDVEHVQSYFVVFKPNLFKSELFDNFINSIKKEKTKEEVIAYYEVGMTKLLAENGFKWDVYCPLSKQISNSHVYAYKKLITENKSPFLKRNILLLKHIKQTIPLFPKRLISCTQYDYELIKLDCKCNKLSINYFATLKYWMKRWRRSVLRIHFKEQKGICLFGHWYCWGENNEE